MENENNEIQKAEIQPIKKTLENIQTIQKVLDQVMKMGCHYDKIDGCGDKPVLLKAGAEKILSTFRIGVEAVIEDLSDDYDRRFRVICRGFYIPTGNTVGYGVGEGSTSEKKYAWRAAVCEEEYEETDETKRQKYWKKGYRDNPATSILQVRQNPSDIANTVLKMAKKRAMVDLCLTATACSDIFDQDLDEDAVQEHIKENGNAQTFKKPQAQPPRQQATATNNSSFVQQEGGISENQAKRLFAIIKGQEQGGYSKDYVDGWLRSLGVDKYQDILQGEMYDDICSNIQNKTIPAPQG